MENEKDSLINNINSNHYKKSGGIATIIKKEIAPFAKHNIDKNGRSITTVINKNKNKKTAITNIYVPTGNRTLTNNFIVKDIATIYELLKKENIEDIIFAGDWNATCDGMLDRWSNFAEKMNKVIFEGIKNFIKENKVIDIWRAQNSETRKYI